MATKKEDVGTLNVYQKLLKARLMFLQGGVKKTGKNMSLEFKYFELEDIIPTATEIFNEVGLITVVNYTDSTASMTVFNVDAPNEQIRFSSPMKYDKENKGKSEIQALGSSHTYLRRYLYMMALDICEADGIDSGVQPVKEEPKKQKPKTPEERKEIKKELTDGNEQADAVLIDAMKKVLKAFMELDPEQEELVHDIALKTDGFKVVTKHQATNIIEMVTKAMEAYEKNEVE